VKLVVIVAAWSVLLVGLFELARFGLRFIHTAAGVGPFLLDRLWYLFLFLVGTLLAVSQCASAYSTMIRSPEVRGWMVLPLSARLLCRAKWLESSFYSAWAVLLLVLPLSAAYLQVIGRPLWGLAWLLALMLPFVACVTAVATAAVLLWLRVFGVVAIRREIAAMGLVAAAAAFFWLLGERQTEGRQDVWFLALQELLPRMQVAMAPWWPSSWVAKAFGAGLQGRWTEGWVYAALLWSSGLVAARGLDHAGAALLLPVLRQTGPGAGRRARAAGAGALAGRRGVLSPLRSCMMKDVLLVLRDPMQWTQGVVFFGLLGAYFANIHRLATFSGDPSWRVGLAALNLACTLLVFGALAVRFLFPQMSLEGRALWMVRTAPGGVRHLVRAKLTVYGLLALAVIETLVWVSMVRLGVPAAIRWWLAGVSVLAALSLVGLTVGLGAWWIDPRAQDPARVVSSSSGALALVCMLVYVGWVVTGLVVAWGGWSQRLPRDVVWATAGLLLVSALVAWGPVWKGVRTLERLETLS
jgi:ABC-2 type transport system permease protein